MPDGTDRHDLARFREAQDQDWERIENALDEGERRAEWIWYVFPIIEGATSSRPAQFYAIRDRGEARAFLDDPVLGGRMMRALALMERHGDKSAAEILGDQDAERLRSSLTLFEGVARDPAPFTDALERFCGGERCEMTRRWLGGA